MSDEAGSYSRSMSPGFRAALSSSWGSGDTNSPPSLSDTLRGKHTTVQMGKQAGGGNRLASYRAGELQPYPLGSHEARAELQVCLVTFLPCALGPAVSPGVTLPSSQVT